jgi:hypothetical protein
VHLKCLRQTGKPKRGILQELLRSMMHIDKRFVHVDYVDPNTGINARYTLRIVLAKKPVNQVWLTIFYLHQLLKLLL